jgi:predicted amidohydrolase YtcJ
LSAIGRNAIIAQEFDKRTIFAVRRPAMGEDMRRNPKGRAEAGRDFADTTAQALNSARRVAMLALIGVAPALLPTPAISQGTAPQLDGGAPETILINGKIVTLDTRSDIAEAVAIRDGKFLAVGSNRQIEALAGKHTTTVDLKGRTVLPGLIDTHAHLENAGTVQYTVPLGKARSVAEALDLIKAMVGKTKPGDWVRGAGWHPPAQLKERRYLTRQEIDSVAPDNPVFLPTVGHFAMANSYALRLANISRDTPNPLGGEIEKDKNGDPTGVLSESAQHMVAAIVPPYPFDLRVTQLHDAMAYVNSYGITSVVAGAVDPRDFRAYQTIWAKHEMTARVSAMYLPTGESVPTESLEDWEKFFKQDGVSSGFGDDWLNFAAIGELNTDGGMTLRTAFTRDPYPDDPTFHGAMNTAPERLNQLVAIANRYDWRVGLHAVGDAAVDKALDAFAYADKEKSIRDRRFILIHGSLMQPDQMARAKALGALSRQGNGRPGRPDPLDDRRAGHREYRRGDRLSDQCPRPLHQHLRRRYPKRHERRRLRQGASDHQGGSAPALYDLGGGIYFLGGAERLHRTRKIRRYGRDLGRHFDGTRRGDQKHQGRRDHRRGKDGLRGGAGPLRTRPAAPRRFNQEG